MTIQVEITESGYLRLPAEVALRHFPHDVAVVLDRGRELWLLPTRGAAAGGMILKQRTPGGDRSVLIAEALGRRARERTCPAFWDEENGALRVGVGEAEGDKRRPQKPAGG